jgi:phosphoglycerol transferase MdoB-like AlkP superfamily enzyme
VSFFDWMLALHLLSAFAVASALVLFSVLVFSGRRMTTLEQTRTLFRVAPVGNVLITAGLGLVLIFGVILALDSDRFNIWDGWVIAAIILFGAFAGVGQRSGAYYTDVQKLAEDPGGGNEAEVLGRLRASKGAMLHFAAVALFVLIVLDMIYKPGA